MEIGTRLDIPQTVSKLGIAQTSVFVPIQSPNTGDQVSLVWQEAILTKEPRQAVIVDELVTQQLESLDSIEVRKDSQVVSDVVEVCQQLQLFEYQLREGLSHVLVDGL